MSANVLATPRLLFALGEQRQVPRLVAATHPRFRTPHVAILISASVSLTLSLSGTFASAATLSTIIRLVTYAATCISVPVLRRRKPGEAAFVLPGGNIIPIVALVLIVWLVLGSSWSEARQVLIAGAAGLLFYWAYTRRARP